MHFFINILVKYFIRSNIEHPYPLEAFPISLWVKQKGVNKLLAYGHAQTLQEPSPSPCLTMGRMTNLWPSNGLDPRGLQPLARPDTCVGFTHAHTQTPRLGPAPAHARAYVGHVPGHLRVMIRVGLLRVHWDKLSGLLGEQVIDMD